MTALGMIEGIGRTLYRDDVEMVGVYPLDAKLELLVVDGRHSRYTGNFAHLAAGFYARMPERDALHLLLETLNIRLEQESLRAIGAAVAQPYLPKLYDDDADEGALWPAVNEPGFIEKRIQEIDASPDRDATIAKAVEGNVEGAERKRVDSDKTVTYVEADGTGVSGLPNELSEKGKNGGPAKTFEAKIGATFNQSFCADGLPLLHNSRIFREPGSAQYMGTVEKIAQFTAQLDDFTRTNDIDRADQIVFISDGAIWLENLRRKLFPCSIGIVDLYHARQHLHKLVESLRFHRKRKQIAFYEKCAQLLDFGDIDQLVALISQKITASNKGLIEKQLEYFIGNKDKMRYGLFRAVGLSVGSGVIEAACKTIVENRLNGSGMRWSKENAANVIALRCAICSGDYDAIAA
jgi:hypothetical protein